jgi:CheY-like chemotaxis protein
VYDIVLMDIQLPLWTGQQQQKDQGLGKCNRREHIPVIAITAHALKQDEQKSREAGCDGHLTKPIKKSSLLEASHGSPPCTH